MSKKGKKIQILQKKLKKLKAEIKKLKSGSRSKKKGKRRPKNRDNIKKMAPAVVKAEGPQVNEELNTTDRARGSGSLS